MSIDNLYYNRSEETVGLSISLLQIQLSGPRFGVLAAHSYSREPLNKLKSARYHPRFGFGPHALPTSKAPASY